MLAQEPQETQGRAVTADPKFRDDVLAGLTRRPRAVPARWFYDRRGSELFEAITELPEYYPTRTEIGILGAIGPDLAKRVPYGAALVEFGSGSSTKTPLLIDAIQPSVYVPIDISGEFLREAAGALSARFPQTLTIPLEADFMRPFALPREVEGLRRIGFFPGSTIGNMGPAAATDLLRAMRETLGADENGRALLLIGMDRVKQPDVLVRAYDDAAGVTAAFNLNLLERINRELNGDIPVDAFRHEARWNDECARIEMHLVAASTVRFTVAGQGFELAAGESIHTENSHKYGPRDARLLLRTGGWTPIAEWTDPTARFAVLLAEAQPEQPAP